MNERENNRRSFLKNAAVMGFILLGVESFSDAKLLVKDAQASGLAPLNNKSMKRHIAKLSKNPKVLREHLSQASRNISLYLDKNFTLSKAQKGKLAKWPSSEKNKLQRALSESKKQVDLLIRNKQEEVISARGGLIHVILPIVDTESRGIVVTTTTTGDKGDVEVSDDGMALRVVDTTTTTYSIGC